MGIVLSFSHVERPTLRSPFRKKTRASSVQGFCSASTCSQIVPAGTKGMPEERILQMIMESSRARGLPCAAPEGDCEKERSARFSGLEALVLFSPEIQWETFRTRPAGTSEHSKGRQWGDVFVKVKDHYPFAFTVYTVFYVLERQRFHGETIVPSPQDVVLNRKSLAARDILRAALKWVNLYYPLLRGKPVWLERKEVLENLTCEPGVEVLVKDLS